MLSVNEALEVIAKEARPLAPRQHDVLAARGLVVAESIRSDIDSPPYDKSTMDGIAVAAATVTAEMELDVLEELTAGMIPSRILGAGSCSRIMTGAPIPHGADAVVMVEKTEATDGGRKVRVQELPIKSGQNIMPRGISMKAGEEVLAAGQILTPAMLGLLAEVGRARVLAHPRPTVAVLSTGNELVNCDETPGPGQIRNSNRPMLWGLVEQAGGVPRDLGVARDTAEDLSRTIREGLGSDLLVLSGGVSAGVLDLVPQVLSAEGVLPVFHKVNLKPGKPIWFGVSPESGRTGRRTLVFGLPGNPVSSLVCFELFVRPAIAAVMGKGMQGMPATPATLTKSHEQRGERPTYWPARLTEGEGKCLVTTLLWKGSGDLKTIADANALAFFPQPPKVYAAGEAIQAFRL